MYSEWGRYVIYIYLAFYRIRVAFPRKFISESVTGIGKTVLQIKLYYYAFKQEICHLLFIDCQFILLQLTDFLYFKLSIFIRVIISAILAVMHIISYFNIFQVAQILCILPKSSICFSVIAIFFK